MGVLVEGEWRDAWYETEKSGGAFERPTTQFRRWISADGVRLFPTLARFDAVYYGHFKRNLRHLYEYPALWDYTRALYQRPGVAATVDLENFKTHYYGSQRRVNPSGVVPLGPRIDFTIPAARR